MVHVRQHPALLPMCIFVSCDGAPRVEVEKVWRRLWIKGAAVSHRLSEHGTWKVNHRELEFKAEKEVR